eukprot:350075-Chlamydomonas_euryale.AAC.3
MPPLPHPSHDIPSLAFRTLFKSIHPSSQSCPCHLCPPSHTIPPHPPSKLLQSIHLASQSSLLTSLLSLLLAASPPPPFQTYVPVADAAAYPLRPILSARM